ncbi:Glycine--tRNA ligase 1, mitochondrial, partial [Ascosphaera pollenicola]
MVKKTNPLTDSMGLKPKNKMKRQEQHIKRKKAKTLAQHKERHARRKEEGKDPALRAERLKKNIPLTLERKRVWDDVGSDVEDGGLG